MSTTRLVAFILAVTAALVGPVSTEADTATGFWAPGPQMSVARDGQPAVVLNDGRILQLGAQNEIYDPGANRWSPAAAPAISRQQQTATLLPDGRVLVVAGVDRTTGQSVPSVEIYDPATNAWSPAASMSGRRYAHSATLLPDGRVLVAGGIRATVTLSSVEIYDPRTNAWSPGAPLPTPLANHTAILLHSGQLLVAGGNDGSETVANAELYDPAANRWKPIGPMMAPRRAFWSTLLRDGRVLVVGGLAGAPPEPGPAAEFFNPDTSGWSAAGVATQPLISDGAAAVVLRDGRLLVCGGASSIYLDPALRSAFIYDPGQDRWSPAALMATGRADHSASLLPDGRVLVAGGRDAYTNGRSLDSTEIFTVASSKPVAASAQPMPVDPPLSPTTRPWLPGLIALIALGLVTMPLLLRRWSRRRRV